MGTLSVNATKLLLRVGIIIRVTITRSICNQKYLRVLIYFIYEDLWMCHVISTKRFLYPGDDDGEKLGAEVTKSVKRQGLM
jgi:hypothetical protein